MQVNDLFLMLTLVPNLLIALAVLGLIAGPGDEMGKWELAYAW